MSKLIASKKASSSKKIWTALEAILFVAAGVSILYATTFDIKQPQAAILYMVFGIIMIACLLRIWYRFQSKADKHTL